MITYEPPKQKEVNVGDRVEGDGGEQITSITDELRRWANGFAMTHKHYELQLLAIADRIDAEHEIALSETINLADVTNVDMAKHGWVRGPLDADGVMWRSGDMSDSNWGVIEGIAYENGTWLISGHDMSAPWIPADSVRHYHAPTVEDVLDEFVMRWMETHHDDLPSLKSEYAAKLRLAEVDA